MNQQLLVLTISSVAAVMLLAGSMQDASAAGYLKIGDIKGESTDDGHKDWINLLSVSQSIDRPSSSEKSKRSHSSATFGDIVLVKEVDASTPKLQEAIAKGTYFPEVQIDFTSDTSEDRRIPYLQWELKNARITSYSFSGSAGDVVPVDQISLNFEEIKVTYTKIDPRTGEASTIEYSWKVEKGE